MDKNKQLLSIRNGNSVKFSKARRIILRDKWKCKYCGYKLRLEDITFDHVLPLSKGGENNVENLVISCSNCNHLKGAKLEFNPDVKFLSKINEWIRYLFWWQK